MAPLPKQIQRELIAKAHGLNPVIMIGKSGLTPSVIAETDRALTDHELIKVRINTDSRQERKKIALALEGSLEAQCLKIIGHIAIIFRESVE